MRTSLAALLGAGFLVALLSGAAVAAAPLAVAVPETAASDTASADAPSGHADGGDDDGANSPEPDPKGDDGLGADDAEQDLDEGVADAEEDAGDELSDEKPATRRTLRERIRDVSITGEVDEQSSTGVESAAVADVDDIVDEPDEVDGSGADGRTAAAMTSVADDVADATTDLSRRPTLINRVGSVVLDTLVGFIHLIDGPPVLPAGSTVSVRTSSLTIPVGGGRSVQADWYFPEEVDDSTRFVYLQHGFLASGPMYSYTAADLAERTNSIVVAPSLSSNFLTPDAVWVGGSTMHRAVADLFVGDRSALAQSASAAAGYAVTLPDRFVMVGHSAGGTLVTSAAGFMVDNGTIDNLAGIVMLDGVEPAGSRLVSAALAKLTGADDRPIYLISSERYFWSRGGDMADKLALARPNRFTGVGLEDGRHIDYMTGGKRLVQFAEHLVAGFSRPQNVDAAGLISAGWVNDLFAGSTDEGSYGASGQVLEIDTPSGVATATVLPLGEPDRPVWPPLLDALLSAVFDFAGNRFFVYEPLRGYEDLLNA